MKKNVFRIAPAIQKKLKSKRAETLVETLVAMLIAVLSVTLLTTAVMTAARINKATKEADAVYQEELAEAELGSTVYGEEQTITITFETTVSTTPETVSVTIYGTGDFASYEKEVEP